MTEQQAPSTPQEKRTYWQQHIDQWQQSGLSQIEYCRRNRIKKYQWGYWKKRLTAPKSPTMLVQTVGYNLMPFLYIPAKETGAVLYCYKTNFW